MNIQETIDSLTCLDKIENFKRSAKLKNSYKISNYSENCEKDQKGKKNIDLTAATILLSHFNFSKHCKK